MEEQTFKIIPKPPIVFLLSGFLIFFFLLALYFKFGSPIPIAMTSIVTNKTELFTTQGEGKVTAVPDIAQINLGVTINRVTVKETQNEANRIINKISEALKKLGIGEKDIKTTGYNLNPTYDWTGGGQRITGYQININLEVNARDFDKINEIIDTATTDGANLVGGLQFKVEEQKLKELQKKAREEAVREAKEKAESLASAAGMRLGKIVNIQENQVTPWEPRPLMLEKAVGQAGAPTQIEPGEQEIKITVTLSYEVK